MDEPVLSVAGFAALQRLARLRLSAEEAARLRPQLEAILGYVRRLEALDAESAEAGEEAAAPLRPDEPRPGLSPGEALAAAPDASEGFFRVPRVLKGPGA